MLGRLYAAEVESALSRDWMRGIVQTRSKAILALKEQGYAQEVERTTPGTFPVKVKGWELTLLGNMAYCMTCTDDGDKCE